MAIHNIPLTRDVYHISDRARERRESELPDAVATKPRVKREGVSAVVEISRRCPVCGAPCLTAAPGKEGATEEAKPICPAAEAFEVEHQHLESMLSRLRLGAPAGIKSFLLQEARLLARSLRDRVESP